MENQFERKPAPNWGWVWQALTGIGLVVLLALHMIAHHFVVPEGLRNFQEVADYLTTPIIVVLEVLFLGAVTAHALLGVRAIIFDFGLSERSEKRVSRVLTIIGVLTVGYGLWLTWTITHFQS